MKKEENSIRKMRKGFSEGSKQKPNYDCSNCGCKRYNPCGCMKKGK